MTIDKLFTHIERYILVPFQICLVLFLQRFMSCSSKNGSFHPIFGHGVKYISRNILHKNPDTVDKGKLTARSAMAVIIA